MNIRLRRVATTLACSCMAMVGLLVSTSGVVLGQDLKPFEKPPEGQTYMGAKQCASCHFDQFLSWRGDKHAKGFEILPAKYKTDASCLKCHTTGYGEETGFKDAASGANLVGTSCEACHGAGSKHAEIAKGFGMKKLTPEQDAYVRSSIYKIAPQNSCISCHTSKGHKAHPKYDK